MMTAFVIGIIFLVIDVLILLIVCSGVKCSKMNLEEKEKFYSKIFGDGVKYRIKIILSFVLLNLLVESLIFDLVFYFGPASWRKNELESTKVYYSGETFQMSNTTILVFDDDFSEEKQYIIVEYEEKVKVTDKAPFSAVFKALKIEARTGRVEYHITSIY